MKRPYLNRLNKKQRRAATWQVGRAGRALPLLIAAGPGTGKTETMAARIAEEIVRGADPGEMMICSFTRKASSQLISRVCQLTESAGVDDISMPYGGTFHSIAVKLLRQLGENIGLRTDFSVIGRDDSLELLTSELKRVKSEVPADSCLAIYSFGKNGCVSVSTTLDRKYKSLVRREPELTKLFAKYEAAKEKQNLVDYDDLLFLLAELLTHPYAGAEIRRRIKFAFVDEFQDTSRLQWRIIRELMPDGRGLTVVGDDAQAIYGFRAATVRNFRDFKKRFGRARTITLTQTYRSTSRLLAATSKIIALSEDDVLRKQLFSKEGKGRKPRLTFVRDEQGQASHVVRRVRRLIEKGVPLGRQAVLFRTVNDSIAVEAELAQAGIPYVAWGGHKFIKSADVRDLIALIRWCQNPRSKIDGCRVLRKLPGIGKKTATALTSSIDPLTFNASLQAIRPSRKTEKEWRRFVELADQLRGSKYPWPKKLRFAADWVLSTTRQKNRQTSSYRATNIERLVSLGKEFGSCDEFLTSAALDDAGAHAASSVPELEGALTLSTIHSAKGREFDAITILSVLEGCIPSSRASSPAGIEEERRVLYVGMTRARRCLELVVPQLIAVRGVGNRRLLFQPGPKELEMKLRCFTENEFVELLETGKAPGWFNYELISPGEPERIAQRPNRRGSPNKAILGSGAARTPCSVE